MSWRLVGFSAGTPCAAVCARTDTDVQQRHVVHFKLKVTSCILLTPLLLRAVSEAGLTLPLRRCRDVLTGYLGVSVLGTLFGSRV